MSRFTLFLTPPYPMRLDALVQHAVSPALAGRLYRMRDFNHMLRASLEPLADRPVLGFC